MAITLSKSQDEIQNMPLVELAYEIFRKTKEPVYFRDLMKEIQELRGMSEGDAMKVIARLYTELNIDGRFLCLGQNVWGLKRWYPVDKTQEKSLTHKRFVRKASGDAFSDEDEDFSDDDEAVDEDEEVLEGVVLDDEDDVEDDTDHLVVEDDEDLDEDEDSDEFIEDDSDEDFSDDEELDDKPLDEELDSDDEDDEEY